MIEAKLHYDDVAIVPEVVTEIESRKDVYPYDEFGYLPVFASCMSSVVSIENCNEFKEAKIHPVLPRTYSLEERFVFMRDFPYEFVAFSLKETVRYFLEKDIRHILNREREKLFMLCIDMANGHMLKLVDTVKRLKAKYGDGIVIMTGNIANPKTYEVYAKAGCDYIRCSIGTGNCCSTSSNTGVHYSIFSLLKECYEIKKANNYKCNIIADGGVRNYRDIQKALIYADYVMIGSWFNKAIESAGKTTYGKSWFNIRGLKIFRPLKTLFTYGREIPRKKLGHVYERYVKKGKLEVNKEVFGMSTKKAQAQINEANGIKSELKTSEGLVKNQLAEFSLKEWSSEETDYLRSAMSYTNSWNLDDYKDSQWIRISQIKYNM